MRRISLAKMAAPPAAPPQPCPGRGRGSASASAQRLQHHERTCRGDCRPRQRQQQAVSPFCSPAGFTAGRAGPLLHLLGSQNHSMVWLGRDLEDHLVPKPCHGQGRLPPDQVAPRPSQPGLEHCQGWGIHNLCGQPVPGPHHPHSEELLPYISSKSTLSHFQAITPSPIATGPCKKSPSVINLFYVFVNQTGSVSLAQRVPFCKAVLAFASRCGWKLCNYNVLLSEQDVLAFNA